VRSRLKPDLLELAEPGAVNEIGITRVEVAVWLPGTDTGLENAIG
ncbi:unnamed protein product, partial [Acidithrix sp. C25]